METMTEDPPLTFPSIWRHKHLLDLERLRSDELHAILTTAQTLKELTDGCRRKLSLLSGKTCANLFFENSTRTRNSFSLAAKRLGADTVEFSSSGSSVAKGETFVDTAKTIEAMGVDWVVTRHHTPGTPHLLARELKCSVLNAGDGPHEHPTQGLLDILTILQNRGPSDWMDPGTNASELLSGMTVAMVGDIAHSRTARSNIWGLKALGAHVIICGPPTLVSHRWEEIGFEVAHRLDDIVQRCDVLNLLRIQFERQYTRPFPSVREYAALYAMNGDRMRRAKEDILIMAPGPINRGVEITPEVADGPHSVILEQVTNGIAVRMAALWLLAGANDAAAG
ncbi:aspartate carbamoyltransferase catalytic subunit [Rhodopirellula rubra]|uniref:Aspartate carbamoyltransferase n=1 Tax=Aporhodopirellula rubra TaxID=980271 RepID=A0A7W5H5E6_9BACT|nr:aspartate carbamoyltransferase catalytic subunit [Aporhodopirellula rubra]MBB3207412.1 aspartate carbamoyltransferase catalytic subunit [Aporhodopirellula rubra]